MILKAKINAGSLRKFEINMNELIGKVERQGKREAIVKAARPIVREAKRRAPVRSGLLKKSIKAKARTYKKNGLIMVLIGSDRRTKGTYRRPGSEIEELVTPSNYASRVEFGHSRAPAHPFLRPAFDAKKGESLAIYKREIGRSIKKVGARLSRRVKF